jgi:hypothetical protein
MVLWNVSTHPQNYTVSQLHNQEDHNLNDAFYFSSDFSEMYLNSGKVRIYTMKSSSAISHVNVDFVSEVSETVSTPQGLMCCVDTLYLCTKHSSIPVGNQAESDEQWCPVPVWTMWLTVGYLNSCCLSLVLLVHPYNLLYILSYVLLCLWLGIMNRLEGIPYLVAS